MPTKIEWAQESWNPVTGCTKVSPGCKNCYAERRSKRLAGRAGYPRDNPFQVTLHPDRLEQPLHWKKPRRVFVCSMGDLFHEDVPFVFVANIIQVIKKCPQHKFIVLTKRPERLLYFSKHHNTNYPNLWLGVTAENQQQANKRITLLSQIPVAMRFVSVEPMLGAVDLDFMVPKTPTTTRYAYALSYLDWVICGTESLGGRPGRAISINTIRNLKNQCIEAGIPFFLKQMPILGMKNGHNVILLQKMPLLDGQVWNQMPGRSE